MKRKIITALAAGAAAVGGMMTGPSGQQIMEQMAQQTEQTQIEQKAPSQQQRVTQQAQNQQRTTNQVIRNYLPAGGSGLFLAGNFGISPKDYGEYLLRTGKNKQNDRKRKHIAKGFA